MSDYEIKTLLRDKVPPLINEIPDPPKKLYYRGELPQQDTKCLAVVGSRKYTTYAKHCVEKIIGGLRGYDIAIISGLALGVDALAHNAALDANLYTLAVPGSGLNDNVLYPVRHRGLASRILESGGGLLSEYEPDFRATRWSFPKRNRIMAGMSHAVLVVEAGPKSGTLITARLATEYNRDVMAIPGSIFSDHSEGPHMLIKLGAIPVTLSDDIIEAFNLEKSEPNAENIINNLSPRESQILEALSEPKDKDELQRNVDIPISEFNTLLSLMELDGHVIVEMNVVRKRT